MVRHICSSLMHSCFSDFAALHPGYSLFVGKKLIVPVKTEFKDKAEWFCLFESRAQNNHSSLADY